MGFKIIVLLLVGVYVSVTTALPSCVCNRRLDPVCGSDGKTYSNQCQFDCAKTKNPDLTLVKTNSCNSDPPREQCLCTLDYTPVCGTDGTTYPNSCALECARSQAKNLEIQHNGQCKNTQNNNF